MSDLTLDAQAISRFRKERYLLSLSEDDFRDSVVRPLFLRLGYRDGRDVCGPTEQGKDAIFSEQDKLGALTLIAVQTKKGSLNLARKAHANIVDAITQLRTAIAAPIPLVATKTACYPTKVYLCASGKINMAAKQHIVAEVKDPRIQFLDADELIPLIDAHLPALWFGIDTQTTPYFRAIKKIVEVGATRIEGETATVVRSDIVVSGATDDNFLPLRLFRATTKNRKIRGQVIPEPYIEEFPVTAITEKRARKVIIAGDAGSGKSTALLRIAYILADRALRDPKEKRTPILLRATDIFQQKASSLIEHCNAFARKLSGSSHPVFSFQDLAAGNVTVLIDALDEISDPADRRIVVDVIDRFHSEFPRCQVILTSRMTRDLAGFDTYARFSLTPLSFRQAEKLARKIQKGTQSAHVESRELLRRIEEVHGIELNPLLVTVFAATAEYSRQDIPANITELFKKFTELMLGRWDETKGLAHQYQAPLKDFLLRNIAFRMHEQRTTSLTRETFEKQVSHELAVRGYTANAKQILHEILDRSGLFRVIGENVEFRHHLLQEFFAGRGILSIDFIKKVISDEWWKRAIVFYFGENPGDISALRNVIQAVAVGSAGEAFEAVTAVGLALQACYLSEVTEKLDVWKWVASTLASTADGLLESLEDSQRFPLTNFLYYYLVGRDSVALSNLRDHYRDIEQWAETDSSLHSEKDSEARRFWLISALVEVRALDAAEKLIKMFKPKDQRHWLAIYLGCRINAEVRLSAGPQKNKAAEICAALEPRVQSLRGLLLKEFGTQLLEMRKGKIAAVDPPIEED
jgi:hypothetical protein